jgi:hypothetical protein
MILILAPLTVIPRFARRAPHDFSFAEKPFGPGARSRGLLKLGTARSAVPKLVGKDAKPDEFVEAAAVLPKRRSRRLLSNRRRHIRTLGTLPNCSFCQIPLPPQRLERATAPNCIALSLLSVATCAPLIDQKSQEPHRAFFCQLPPRGAALQPFCSRSSPLTLFLEAIRQNTRWTLNCGRDVRR